MPLMYVSAIESSVTESAQATVSLTDALGYSGLGVGIVFVVLVVLMAFITLMSAFLKGTSSKPKASPAPKPQAPAPAPVVSKPVAAAPATAPDGAMFVTLGGKRHVVSVEEKIPQFTVKLGGKTHNVDVEFVEEVAE